MIMRSMYRCQRYCMPFFLSCALAMVAGCGRSPRELSVVVAGDTKGWITPCGCAANQSGGLARRATLLDGLRRDHDTLFLDVGGSAIGTSQYQHTRLRYLLQGLALMRLDAHNIGASETAFSPAELRSIGQQSKTQWLSSNLLDHEGKPVGSPILHVERAGVKIDVAGVVDPMFVEHPDWQSTEPLQAVVRAFHHSKADVRIVLAYLDEKALKELASALPEVDYVIGGPTGQSINPARLGGVTLLSATNKGKFLGQLQLAKSTDGFREVKASIVEVKSELAENASQLENLQAYYRELASKDYTSTEAGLVEATTSDGSGYSIAGSQSCAKCHEPDNSVWHLSKHSHAWDVLQAKKAHFDPNCQQCHSTGYGQDGGFVNVAQSSERTSVGCENCHGPSQAHVLDPKKRTPFQAKQQCVTCHDHENSPAFQSDTYWAKIFHAGSKVP